MKLKSRAMAAWPTARITACSTAYAGETRLHPDHTWTAIEHRIHRDLGAGQLVRIRRLDRGHNYSAPGAYRVWFIEDRGLERTLDVEFAAGEKP